MRNRNVLFIFAGLFIVLALQSICAIGITPGRTTINFEKGLSQEVSFSIINSEHKDMSVVFMVKGEFADIVTLNQAYAEFSSSEESKSFTYTVNLHPSLTSKPGKHEVEIVALEMPKDIKEKGALVGATMAVATQLHIYVPYPSKYLEAEVHVLEGEDGRTTFFIPVFSRGKVDIVNAQATIDIYTSLNEKIATIESDSESLASLEKKELVAEWDANVNPAGKYRAVVSVFYDNKVAVVEKEFDLGEMSLEIKEIIIKDFELGGIAKFNTLVENKWSSELKNAFLNIIVYNDEGEIMADFKSPLYDLAPLGKSEMVCYWDTAGVKKGTYEGKLILKFGEKTKERNIEMKITENNIEVIGLTGHVVVNKKGKLNVNNLLIILVVFLILVNIVWFVVVKKLIKKK